MDIPKLIQIRMAIAKGRIEGSPEFHGANGWAKMLRSMFPDEPDYEIIDALCEIIREDQAIIGAGKPAEPVQEENPMIILTWDKKVKYDFSKPNHHALTQMDSFLQYDGTERKQEQWDRTIRGLFLNDGGKGWEGVEKNDPSSFRTAWAKAVLFCVESGKTWQEISEG